MSAFNIEVEGGKSVKLPTAGKYCDRDIVVSAKEGGGGYDEGYADGEQAEYDRFWDLLQNNGKRVDYFAAFCSWADEAFNPKYDIVPTGSVQYMFSRPGITNLLTLIEKAGIVFDTSKANTVSYVFNANSTLVEAPLIDASNSTSISRLFNGCESLKRASVFLPANKLTDSTNAFSKCYELEDLVVSGVIDIPLSFTDSSKLTSDSVQSIIDHLKDLTGATAQTLTLHATVGGKLTDAQKATITAKNWTLVY